MILDPLVRWFRAHQRDLPWRDFPSPYAVWVSEVMLQQTQVKTVIPYFSRWMEQFPTIPDLAKASEESVIKAWEGLGYYSRARSLLKAARQCVERFDGELPADPEKLGSLKGIGPYTQGAILSFAFNQRAAAVDGNVLRVMSRLQGSKEDISLPSTKKEIERSVLAALPLTQPWVAMEALIELGALICVKKPRCPECPLQSQCEAYRKGLTGILPVKKKGPAATRLKRYTFLIVAEKHILLKKGEKGRVMADLWEFPYFENSPPEHLGEIQLSQTQPLPPVRHSFTRYQVELIPYRVAVNALSPIPDHHWVQLDQLHRLPFSSGHRRLLTLLHTDQFHLDDD